MAARPLPSVFPTSPPPKPGKQSPIHLPLRRRSAAAPLRSASEGGDEGEATTDGGTASASIDQHQRQQRRQPRRQPPSTPTIRYVPRSKRRARERQREAGYQPPPPPQKKWEEMTVGEKATELYVGEKGLLFWLNKIAYAAIFLIVGGWIVFRFVGPALDLYHLDGPMLSPDSVFKGS